MNTSNSTNINDTDTDFSFDNNEGIWYKPIWASSFSKYVTLQVKMESPKMDFEKFKKLYDDYKMTKERLEISVKNGWGDAISGDKEWFGECQFELMQFIEKNVDTIFTLINKK